MSLKERFVRWLLKGVRLEELSIGEGTITIDGTNVTLPAGGKLLGGDGADKLDGHDSGLGDGQVAVLPSATAGKFLKRGATAWEAADEIESKTWVIPGDVSTGTEQGGAWIVDGAYTLLKAYIYAKTTGSSGSTICDINKNGTTIFSTQANRPTLAYNDSDKKAVSGTPDVTAVAEGDIVTLDVDAVATGAKDVSVTLLYKAA